MRWIAILAAMIGLGKKPEGEWRLHPTQPFTARRKIDGKWETLPITVEEAERLSQR
jgi:hypothetical protein